ncbi:MAG: GAF domain-containing protein [Cyanobacteria bacterium J06598_4]
MLHQYEYSKSMQDLSWKNIGQSIVDGIAQLLDIDIAILYLRQVNPRSEGPEPTSVSLSDSDGLALKDTASPIPKEQQMISDCELEQHFFYQKLNAEVPQIDRDLLKLTVISQTELASDRPVRIRKYSVEPQQLPTSSYQACLQANIAAIISIPLCFQANLEASLTIHHFSLENCLEEADIAVLETLATQASLMLSQMLATKKLQELAQRATTINRITTAIRSSLNPPVMFAAIAKELGSALGVDGCTLSLWTKSDHFVRCVGLYNPHEQQKIVIDSPVGRQATTSSVPIAENPILQALLFKQKTIDLSDLEEQKALARYELPWHAKARALMIVPLIFDDEIIGSITLRQSDDSRHWTAAEIELAEAVASQAAIAINQVLAHQQVTELAQRETTINRITATIRSSLEPPIIFSAIAKELGLALQVDGCTLSLWTKSDRFVRCVGLYNPHEPQKIILDSPDWQQATNSSVPIAENPILQALLFKKKTVKSTDLEKQKNLARYELPWHAKARALMIVPLIVEDEIIGSITLRQSDTSRDWHNSEIELAEAVASQAAIAVQQAKLYQKLKKEEKKVRKLNYYLTESVLKRFLPAAIVNKAATGRLSLDLTPEPRRITVLFCDLVSFTNLSSRLEVLPLAEILNEYLEAMSKAVFDQGGTVDKFIGDGVMAMFGAPENLSCPEQARRAVSTAKTMYFYLQMLNQRWQAKAQKSDRQIPIIKMRCGIHQGKAVVGMFGGGQRKDYTAVGKVVNIASRLQSVATPNSILISEATANALDKNAHWGQGRNLKLKGIDKDFRAYTIKVKD